ncbi:hypothetical protein M2101_000647 [Parabacteroides sp. PM5-20]|uniref:hypothetical protein n=1 Tax=unclassified Parabacteroides TaxID=2649774 RepID=UPI0013D25213|nr:MULTISPECIES: hypothetical protein [unclassified Parabacteroides]MDH6533995.1 hypothetical protein [Parabacteroides sp. PM5-20]
MNQEKTSVPANLYDFYTQHPEKFEMRTDQKKKVLYYVLIGVCLLLLVIPSLLPISALLVRIIAGLGLVVFGFSAYAGGSDYYNKESGGKITNIRLKKFDGEEIGEEQIVTMFEQNDIKGLADAPSTDNQPIQLYVHEDALGKEFYLQVMKFYSSSDFRGLTPVKVIKEPEYSKLYSLIQHI